MTNPKFEMGDRVENIKNKRVGFVKKRRGEGVYLVSVQGYGECAPRRGARSAIRAGDRQAIRRKRGANAPRCQRLSEILLSKSPSLRSASFSGYIRGRKLPNWTVDLLNYLNK